MERGRQDRPSAATQMLTLAIVLRLSVLDPSPSEFFGGIHSRRRCVIVTATSGKAPAAASATAAHHARLWQTMTTPESIRHQRRQARSDPRTLSSRSMTHQLAWPTSLRRGPPCRIGSGRWRLRVTHNESRRQSIFILPSTTPTMSLRHQLRGMIACSAPARPMPICLGSTAATIGQDGLQPRRHQLSLHRWRRRRSQMPP